MTQEVHIPGHAEDMWLIRHGDGEPPCPLSHAWEEAFDVDIPGVDGETRMHAQTETLLVHHPETQLGIADRVLRTVLHARDEDLERYCDVCEGCGEYIRPGMYLSRCRACQVSSDA